MSSFSDETAIKYLRAFFQGVPGDEVSIKHVIESSDYANKSPKQQRNWLSYITTGMRSHEFFSRRYSESGEDKGKLIAFILTDKGRRMLRRLPDPTPKQTSALIDGGLYSHYDSSVDVAALLERVNHEVEVIQNHLPSYEVDLVFKRRKDSSQQI